jgi:hydrogenase/urease accessory protein HupE
MQRALSAAAALLLSAEPAWAHPPPLGISGFTGGLLHPLFVPAHLMAIVGLGLLIGQQRSAWGLSATAMFVAGVLAGLGAIALAYAPQWTGTALPALALVVGALVALAQPLPRAVGVLLAAIAGSIVGLDSPPDTVSVQEANRMLLGTALGAIVLLLAASEMAACMTRPWGRIGIRILGSWIAASAALVLVVQAAR